MRSLMTGVCWYGSSSWPLCPFVRLYACTETGRVVCLARTSGGRGAPPESHGGAVHEDHGYPCAFVHQDLPPMPSRMRVAPIHRPLSITSCTRNRKNVLELTEATCSLQDLRECMKPCKCPPAACSGGAGGLRIPARHDEGKSKSPSRWPACLSRQR